MCLQWVRCLHGWGTFRKCRAGLSYHLVLGPLFWEHPPPWGLYSTLNGVEHTTQSLRWPGTLTTIGLKGCNNQRVSVNLQLVIFCEVLCKILELPIDACRLSSFSVDLKYCSTLATSKLIILFSEMLKFLKKYFLINKFLLKENRKCFRIYVLVFKIT